MKATCKLCGDKIELSRIHKDYQKVARNPGHPFICSQCNERLQWDAREMKKNKPT